MKHAEAAEAPAALPVAAPLIHNPPPGVREIETTTVAGEYFLPPKPKAPAAAPDTEEVK